ncbi:MAG TPA: hypothetical protein VHO90_12605 [Bacteroidales bacterium]|nr:hypothetical protein [Bacteroidales bacterium]
MSKLRYGALIVVIVVALVATYFFLIRHEVDVLQKVPANAKTVTVVNTRALVTRLFLEGLVKEKSKENLQQLIPDSLRDLDWTSTGLGLPNKIVFFTLDDTLKLNNRLFFISPVANSSKYNRFMDSLCVRLKTTIKKEQDVHYAFIGQLKVLLAWNNQFVTGVISPDAATKDLPSLATVLSNKKESSVLADTSFVAKLSRDFDVMFYIKSSPKSSLGFTNGIENEIRWFVSYVRFNKGEVAIDAQALLNKESSLNELFSVSEREMATFANDAKAIISISTNINPNAFFKLMNQSSPLKIKRMPWMNNWDGRLNIGYFGNKYVETSYSTYEYDDNFNKVEVKKTSRENVMNIRAVWGMTDVSIADDSLVVQDKDTLLFPESNFVLQRFGNFFTTHNKHFDPSQLTQKKIQGGLSITMDNTHLASFIKTLEQRFPISANVNRWPVEKTTFTLSKGFNSSLKFYFSDKNHNSLLTIISALSGKKGQ